LVYNFSNFLSFGTARRHDPIRTIVKNVVPGPGRYKERSYTAVGRGSYR